MRSPKLDPDPDQRSPLTIFFAELGRRISGRHGNIRYVQNSAWLLAEKLFRLAVGFSVGVYVVRYLGPTSYGELAYAVSFVGLFTALVTLGLPSLVVRELVENPNRRGEILGSAFVLTFGAGVLTVFLISLVAPLTKTSRTEHVMILILAGGYVFQCFMVIDYYFQSIARSRYVVQAQFVQLLISSSMRLFLIWGGASLVWFAVVALVDAVVLAAGLLSTYWRSGPVTGDLLTWRFRWRTARSLLRDAWPLMLSGMVVAVYMRIDQVMIRAMLDADAVGQYAAAVRISEAWYFVPVLIAQSYFPAIIAARSEGRSILDRQIQDLYNFLVWLALIVAILGAPIADTLIGFLYGPAFAESSRILAIHIWAGVFLAAAVVRGRWVVAMKLHRIAFFTVLVGATLNVVGNLVLIPVLGMTGAAWSTVGARLASFYLGALLFREIRDSIRNFHRALLWPFTLLMKRTT